MQVDITFDDPKSYAMPFTLNLAANYVPDDELIESVCLENEKDRGKLVGKIADEKQPDKTVAANVLADYVGKYEVGPLGVWTVSASGGTLFMELAKFVLQSSGGTVTFVRDAKTNAVTHLLLTIVEGDFKGERK
jgi:hypothetical protein